MSEAICVRLAGKFPPCVTAVFGSPIELVLDAEQFSVRDADSPIACDVAGFVTYLLVAQGCELNLVNHPAVIIDVFTEGL